MAAAAAEHRLVVGAAAEVHGEILRLAGGRVDAVGVARVWGGVDPGGTDVRGPQVVFEGGISDVVIRRGLAEGKQ